MIVHAHFTRSNQVSFPQHEEKFCPGFVHVGACHRDARILCLGKLAAREFGQGR